MAFEDLKDQVKERFTETWSKIQETPLYNSLREKYETLPVGGQIGIIVGSALLVTFFLLSIPLSYYSSSSNLESQFNDDRSLLRGLLRASRIASDSGSIPHSPSVSELKNQIQNMMQQYTLLPEQLGPILDLEANALNFGTVAQASGIQQQGLGVSLKKLNLKQTVDIGFDLQRMNPGVKIAGMEINASSPDPHYFDVLYKLVVFSVPEAEGGSAAAGAAPGGGGATRGGKRRATPTTRNKPTPGVEAAGEDE